MVRRFGLSFAARVTAAGLAAGHLALSAPATAAEPQNAAHSIAQRFADKPVEKPAARPASTSKQKVVETPVVVPAAKPQAIAESATSPTRPPLDYEMDMLRRARAERAEHQKTAASPNGPNAAAPVATTPLSGVKPPSTATVSPAAATAAAPAPVTTKLAAAPQTDRPKSEAENTSAPKSGVSKPSVQANASAPPAKAPAAKPDTPTVSPAQPVTILLTIDGDGTAAAGQSHDPVICFGESCFVSAGLSAAAIKVSKGDVLKLKSTGGVSPDSCKGKVACVYRNVGLEKGALLQLIELGSASGDPSRTYLAEPDTSCKSTDGVLICDNPIATPDFRVWVVPEATANSAGSPSIEDAIADGLPHENVARGTDK
jgi:hypothetical protein